MIAIDFLESSASETLLVVVLENWVEFVSRYLGADMIDWRSTGDAKKGPQEEESWISHEIQWFPGYFYVSVTDR